ncbi:hypothetical protein DFH09DRAFT_1477775 [Mycena vulgaris]|nr:hypothetical protein DFH09DRAFT_1477775 [Mycena vulgaris]
MRTARSESPSSSTGPRSVNPARAPTSVHHITLRGVSSPCPTRAHPARHPVRIRLRLLEHTFLRISTPTLRTMPSSTSSFSSCPAPLRSSCSSRKLLPPPQSPPGSDEAQCRVPSSPSCSRPARAPSLWLSACVVLLPLAVLLFSSLSVPPRALLHLHRARLHRLASHSPSSSSGPRTDSRCLLAPAHPHTSRPARSSSSMIISLDAPPSRSANRSIQPRHTHHTDPIHRARRSGWDWRSCRRARIRAFSLSPHGHDEN